MDAHGTCQLGDTGDRKLHFLAGGHDQVTKLINDHYDVWHVLMSVCQAQFMIDVLLVVFLDVSGSRLLQQVVAAVHQNAETVERADHLGYIGDDRLVLVSQCRHELVGDA